MQWSINQLWRLKNDEMSGTEGRGGCARHVAALSYALLAFGDVSEESDFLLRIHRLFQHKSISLEGQEILVSYLRALGHRCSRP